MSEMSNTSSGSGLDLKAFRKSKGLTIEAIFNATKVRPAFLEAIENGDFGVLPERIYSEAFIKTYAAQIGVNPEDILSRYRRFLNVPEPGKVPDKKADKKTEKKAEKRKDEGKSQAVPAPEPKKPEPSKIPEAPVAKSSLNVPKKKFSRVAISLILTVLVICGGFLYFLLSDDASGPEVLMKAEKPAATPAPDTKDMKPAETPPQPAAEQPGTNADPSAPASQSASATDMKPAAAASNKLVIHANELTWISVTEDGGPAYQIMLRPGDNLERIAGKFMLDIGNAGGIVVNFNGTDMGVPGRSGQVVHLILPQETSQEAPKE